MSARIKNNADFFRLLLQTHPAQQKLLLQSVSAAQTDLLTEIAWNLLHVVPLPPKEKKALARKKFLRELSVLKRSSKYRQKRVTANKVQIIKILQTYAAKLVELANQP